MFAADSESKRLLEHLLAKARAALEAREDFNPLGSILTCSGDLRDYGGEAGVEHQDRRQIYRLLRAGFCQDAAQGRIRAAAVAVNAAAPEGVKARFKRSVAVLVETPGSARRIYLPYRMRFKLPGVRGRSRVEYGRLISTNVKALIFTGTHPAA